MNGLLGKLKKLKGIFNGKFIIPLQVKNEVVDNPIKRKRFELEALQIQRLIENKILELPNSLNLNEQEILHSAKELLDIANNAFYEKNKAVHILDLGEASCLAVSKILTKQKIRNVLAVDERTLRVLCEKPDNLKQILQKKLHTAINYKKENLNQFAGCDIIRSTELIYVAYKKGLTELKGKLALDAFLYALKFKGCSITQEEIEEIKKIG